MRYKDFKKERMSYKDDLKEGCLYFESRCKKVQIE